MNNDNIVKIGAALKWRGVYDPAKRYYQENIITLNGCVFRLKVLTAIGIPPVEFEEESGHLVYVNGDVWDVVVDMAAYYNHAIDSANLIKKTWEAIESIGKEVKVHHNQIIQLQEYQRRCQLEHEMFKLEHQAINKRIDALELVWFDVENHQERIARLEALVPQLLDEIDRQKEINRRQQEQIDDLLNSTVKEPGKAWDNDKFWNNSASWFDNVLGDKIPVIDTDLWQDGWTWNNDGLWFDDVLVDPDASGIVVASYDSETSTVELGAPFLLIESYDQPTRTLLFKTDYVKVKDYSSTDSTLSI